MSKRWLGLLLLVMWIGGSGVAHATVTANPDPLTIGSVTLGQSGTGTTSLTASPSVTINSFDMSPASCNEFTISITPPLPQTVSGSAKTVTVTLTPTSTGAKSCLITARDAANTVLGTFTATGTAVAPAIPAISVTPASANLGSVRVANAAVATATQTFTLSNAGGAGSTLTISNITFSDGNYTIQPPPTFPITIAAGSSQTITVQFDPSSAGTHDATMTLASNDPATPSKAVNLTGIGTTALIAAADFNFGTVNNGATSNQNVIVTNSATNSRGVLTLTSATITGGSFFSFGTGQGCNGGTSCTFTQPFTVTAGTLNIPVRCQPPVAATGMQTATVTINSDTDGGGDNTAQLTCIAGRPNIIVSTNALAFGSVAVASTSTQTVTIMNTGTATLTYSVTENPDLAEYTIPTGCTSSCSIAAGGMATFNVRFAPTTINTFTTQLSITNNDPDPGDSPFLINVSGTGTAPQISVAPTSLSFANTEVGRTSTAKTVTATNNGNSLLTISSATFQTGAADYIVTGQTGSQTIVPSASASWSIACKPSARGARPGTFRIASNSLTGATTDVTLSCTGESGIVATSPTSINFGAVAAGTTKPLTFTLQNTGNVPITGLTGTLNNATLGYQFNAATVPTTLAAGASTTLMVTFAPQSGNDGGPTTITFSAVWGATNTPTTATLALDGDGLSNGYDISPMAIDFSNFRFDTRPKLTYQIINSAQADVSIQTHTFTPDAGTATTEFGFVLTRGGSPTPLSLPQTLTPGQRLDVTVTAQPNSRIGLVSGHVDIHSNLAMLPDRRLTLTGNSTTAAISVPAMVDFGPVDVDGPAQTRMVMLTNNGAATLDVTSITKMTGASPAFTVTLPSGATQIAPGNSLSLTITYKPTVERPANQFDTAVLVSGLAGIVGGPTQAMITLQGRGIDRHLAIDAVEASFPITPIHPGDAAPTRAITVHNTGEATLSITALMLSGDPAWQLVDEAPVDIAGGESHDFLVKFVPTVIAAYTGELTLINNDNDKPMASVTLTGEAVFVDAEGGGGCSASGTGVGSLAFGVFAACRLLGRRRRRRAGLAIATAALVATVVIAPVVHADGISAAIFEPTPATSRTGFQLQSPEVGADGSWVGSSILSYASNLLVLKAYSTNGISRGTLIERRSLLQLGGAYAFLGRFEAGAHIPFYMQSGQALGDSQAEFMAPPASGTALGNLTLHAKARLWQGGGLVAGASGVVVVPTASKGQFTGSDQPEGRLLLLGSFTPAALASRLAISANGGAVVRGKSEYANIVQKSGVAWGVGASYRVLDALWATAELFGEATPAGKRQQGTGTMPPASTLSPIEWLAGMSYKVDRRFTIGLAGGRGVTNGLGTPTARGVLSLAFVPGAAAIAPIHPAELPRPDRDSDGDGLVDKLDRCPREPEDQDGFQDDDGCPDPDNDGDRIADARDKCPDEPEDQDGFQDDDGCPDPDNDGDHIADAQDRCPNQPEDNDGFEDNDGCPDPDNDGDGIADAQDKCPDQPETINGKEDDDGCPDAADAASVAEDTFTQGRELLKQGKYQEACAAFEQSQRLDPQFGTEYNIAGCYEKIGKLAAAWNLYRALARSDTNPTRRSKASGFAASLASRVPKIKLVMPRKPKGVQVHLNGENANALIGIETPVDVGSYGLVVSATGYRAWRKTVDIKEEGKVVTVVINLEPVH